MRIILSEGSSLSARQAISALGPTGTESRSATQTRSAWDGSAASSGPGIAAPAGTSTRSATSSSWPIDSPPSGTTCCSRSTIRRSCWPGFATI